MFYADKTSFISQNQRFYEEKFPNYKNDKLIPSKIFAKAHIYKWQES
ncbi:hypothetical protein ASZ90_005160 [hydrocarbon metagenome]|uniref:Uncharacterized protein n=1 Tax=hydrocarbon metagenome TaxID=938273 RepID=A0A0W8FWC8_9ZZZZ